MAGPMGEGSGVPLSLAAPKLGPAATSWLSPRVSDSGPGAWENFLVVATYSQRRLCSSQRLHRGESPEHFVLCVWHSWHAFCARFLTVPASVRSLDGVTRDGLPEEMAR